MGTWGVGLYDDDDAADLRDAFKDVVRAPWDADRLAKWADDSGVDESTRTLVLADLFWKYGIDHPPTFERAMELATSGADLRAKEDLGMSEKELRKREAKLLDAVARWKTPNAKPTPRKVLSSPESFLFEIGACVAFPTEGGIPKNPYVGPKLEERFPWKADGWGAFLVLARRHRFEVFAQYLAMPIYRASPAEKPTLREVRDGALIEEMDGEGGRRTRGTWSSTTRQHLKRMQTEELGRLEVDPSRVASAFASAGNEADLASILWPPPRSSPGRRVATLLRSVS